MANQPKKISVGNRTVVGDQVINAGDSLVEREQLNRILQNLKAQLTALEAKINALPVPGGGEEGSNFELVVDPTNFSLENIEGETYYLDIIPGGIGTTELADAAVTTVKIADANVTIPKLSATGVPDATTFHRGDDTWAAPELIDYDEIETDESLADGDFVNVFDDGGTPKVRLAQANSCDTCAKGHVRAAWTAGQTARVYRPSTINPSLSGLTPGLFYYLDSTTAGAVTDTPDMTDGYIIQNVGWAISSTELVTNYQEPETVGYTP